MTNDIKKGDLIIKSYTSNKTTLNKVTFINETANILRYDRISGDLNYSFGIDTLRNMSDLSHILGRKCNIELNTLFVKVINTGFKL